MLKGYFLSLKANLQCMNSVKCADAPGGIKCGRYKGAVFI